MQVKAATREDEHEKAATKEKNKRTRRAQAERSEPKKKAKANGAVVDPPRPADGNEVASEALRGESGNSTDKAPGASSEAPPQVRLGTAQTRLLVRRARRRLRVRWRLMVGLPLGPRRMVQVMRRKNGGHALPSLLIKCVQPGKTRTRTCLMKLYACFCGSFTTFKVPLKSPDSVWKSFLFLSSDQVISL